MLKRRTDRIRQAWSWVAIVMALALMGSSIGSSFAAEDLYDSPVVQRIKASGKLRAGVAQFLPFVGLDPTTGQHFGTGVEIGKKMAEKLGVELEIVPQDWAVIVAGLQSGQIDVAIAGLFVTLERLKVVDMYPYATMGTCWIALATNDKVNELADLNNSQVIMAQQEGGGTYQLSRAKYPNAQQLARFVGSGAEFANITEVVSGQADVAPFDSVMVPVVKADFPNLKVIPANCPEVTDFTAGISVAYNKRDHGMHQVVQEVVAENRDEIEANLLKFSDVKFLRKSQ